MPPYYQGNALPPISVLPEDVLEAVFHKFVSSVEHRLYPAVRLSHVCRYWRDILFGSGEFWAIILPDCPTIAKHYLARSKGAPLRVFWENHPAGVSAEARDEAWILSQSSRFRSLRLARFTKDKLLSMFTAIAPTLPRLERLEVQGGEPSPDMSPIPLRIKAPNLRHLNLGFLGDVEVEGIHTLLQEAPSLHTVNFDQITFIPSQSNPMGEVINACHIRNWSFTWCNNAELFLDRMDIFPANFHITDELDIHLPNYTKVCLGRAAAANHHTWLALGMFAQLVTHDPDGHAVFQFHSGVPRATFLSDIASLFEPIIQWNAIETLQLNSDPDEQVSGSEWDRGSSVWVNLLSRVPNARALTVRGFPNSAELFHALASCRSSGGRELCCSNLERLHLSEFNFSREATEDQPWSTNRATNAVEVLEERKRKGLMVRTLVLDSCYISPGHLTRLRACVGEIVTRGRSLVTAS